MKSGIVRESIASVNAPEAWCATTIHAKRQNATAVGNEQHPRQPPRVRSTAEADEGVRARVGGEERETDDPAAHVPARPRSSRPAPWSSDSRSTRDGRASRCTRDQERVDHPVLSEVGEDGFHHSDRRPSRRSSRTAGFVTFPMAFRGRSFTIRRSPSGPCMGRDARLRVLHEAVGRRRGTSPDDSERRRRRRDPPTPRRARPTTAQSPDSRERP